MKRCRRGAARLRIPHHARRLLSLHADGDRYLSENLDVSASGSDPFVHWWRTGAEEGRRMPGVVRVECRGGMIRASSVRNRWRALLGRDGRRWRLEPDPDFALEAAFVRLVHRHADRRAYLAANLDVRAADIEPVEHWLTSGMLQGRRMPGLDVVLRRPEEREGWVRLRWLGQDVLVRPHEPLPETIERAVRVQAQFEPGLLAAGPGTVGSLRRVDALDLWDRDGLDLAGFLAAIESLTRSASVVVVVPELAELASLDAHDDVLAELAAPAPRDLLLLVTRQLRRDAPREVRTPAGVVPRAAAIYLLDHRRSAEHPDDALLARILHALDPDAVHGFDPRSASSS